MNFRKKKKSVDVAKIGKITNGFFVLVLKT